MHIMRSAGLIHSATIYVFFFQVQGRYSDTAQVIPYCLGRVFFVDIQM